MPLFVLVCKDKPQSLALRMATREDHLAYARSQAAKMKLGGPILDDNGDMAGSIIILDVADIEEARAFTQNDPYSKAGLFGSVDVLPFKATLGQLG
jgi:uncharacterized protein